MTLTFVSSLFGKENCQNIQDLLHDFEIICMNGYVCLYVTQEYEEILRTWANKWSNVKIVNVIQLEETWIYNLCNNSEEEILLPENRNTEKDTRTYILNGYTKHELLEDVIEKNPWNTSHFLWLDMHIPQLFKNKVGAGEYIRWFSKSTLSPSFITFPGCWSKLEKDKVDDILKGVHWRFCGGFLIGDGETIRNFCSLYKEKIQEFLKEYKVLIWDFNFWAYMETFCESDKCKMIWYKGDHNDSILNSSADIYTRSLNVAEKIEYDYPKIETYYSMSASYLYWNEKHWLNTRYVNYWIFPNGNYLFNNRDGRRLIENKNMISELTGESSLKPVSYREITETIDLPVKKDGISVGLEDVRLYELNGRVKYIATTTGYSPSGKSRMIIGDYDIENACINDGRIITPPNTDSHCEKNWIPIVREGQSDTEEDEELFIYKWFPMEIGKVNYDTGELVIIHHFPISLPIFSKVRGSSTFQEVEEGLLGVVHFSEDHGPRHYYHMLVVLDKNTFAVLKYSETFCFEKLGIEFCIGFTMTEDGGRYVFWISRHDRDPIMMEVNVNEIKWM